MYFEENLKLLISSRHLFIYILSSEEDRLEYTITKILDKYNIGNIYYWNFIDGYNSNPNYINRAKRDPLAALELVETIDSSTPKFFLFKDFHLFINDTSIIRKMKNLHKKLKNSNSYIFIIASEMKIPTMLKSIVTLIEFSLPSFEEILIELKRLFSLLNINSNISIERMALAYKGMSIELIRRSIAKIVSLNRISPQIFRLIAEEKKQYIRQTHILDFCSVNYTLNDIGGLFYLKQWLKKRSYAFTKQAQNYGLPAPKGILLVGIQGTGKSLSAKVIAKQWNLPLFRLDVGKIFGGVVGESEKNIREIIKLSEELEPCVLWIDEIDKVFSRLTNNIDSGTTNRVLSTLLIWLSEKNNQVFVVATANNVLCLPPEILRKGRFDEIFFLDLPNFRERNKIFQIHLMKFRPLTWKKYNLNSFSELTDSFSGAEIKQAIVEAMYNAFYEKRDFNNNDIINAINDTVPLAFTDNTTISSMQNWAKMGKVRLASK
uniref:Uncharacterized AAA domain-containing protein ycf46 n=1 Tax=Caulacanthus okamurae TaxID=152008 RepID=A0A6H1U6P7_9FLOR|nr:hypothetical protein [Caulacanthus okamurae]QIZ74568.1 hypothetical protein [Caulacanthus okamurae]